MSTNRSVQQLLRTLARILATVFLGRAARSLSNSGVGGILPGTDMNDDSTGAVAPPDPNNPHGHYPGDYAGLPRKRYAPDNDNEPDPGEVVWAWVPYEEDWTRGKDRPVLIVGTDNGWCLALPLSSVDHDFDKHQEERAGRYWVEVGTGSWDSEHRDSFARVDRIVRIQPQTVRRIGGHVSSAVYDKVFAELQQHWAD